MDIRLSPLPGTRLLHPRLTNSDMPSPNIFLSVCCLFYTTGAPFPLVLGTRVNGASGEKYARRVEEGFREDVGERTKQIDASGAEHGRFSRSGNYREAPQMNVGTSPPKRIQCSGTLPTISQTPRTVGDPSLYWCLIDWCKFLEFDC